MKTQTPIFPPPSPHLYTTSVVFRWQPCLFIFLRIALLLCVSDNAQGYFFFPPYSPRVLGSWDLNPSLSIYSSLRAFSPFSFTRTGFSVFTTRILVLNLSRVLTTISSPPLLSNRCIFPHPRPAISILILFTKFFSCFLGVLVVTVLWFFFLHGVPLVSGLQAFLSFYGNCVCYWWSRDPAPFPSSSSYTHTHHYSVFPV